MAQKEQNIKENASEQLLSIACEPKLKECTASFRKQHAIPVGDALFLGESRSSHNASSEQGTRRCRKGAPTNYACFPSSKTKLAGLNQQNQQLDHVRALAA